MSQELTPLPTPENPNPSEHAAHNGTKLPPGPGDSPKRKRARSHRILTTAELMEQLSALPSLIALGLISPSRANSIRSCCEGLLRAQVGSVANPRTHINDEDVLKVFREKPEYLEFLEAFITDQQVAMLFGQQDDERD
jgi:hypothetical protein